MKTLHVRKASNLWQATIGLIGSKKPYPLLLHTRFGIHTFGVRFPLDIIILDTNYQVKKLKPFLQPNRLFFWWPYWAIVIELPAGTIAHQHIHLGDTLKIMSS